MRTTIAAVASALYEIAVASALCEMRRQGTGSLETALLPAVQNLWRADFCSCIACRRMRQQKKRIQYCSCR